MTMRRAGAVRPAPRAPAPAAAAPLPRARTGTLAALLAGLLVAGCTWGAPPPSSGASRAPDEAHAGEPASFRLEAEPSHTLVRGDGYTIQVGRRELAYEAAGTLRVLHRWPWDGLGRAWRAGDLLLVGAAPDAPTGQGSPPAGGSAAPADPAAPRPSDWLLLRLSAGGGLPQVERLGELPPPDQVDGIRAALPPGLWLLVAGAQEWAVLPDGAGVAYVN